jgi:hypothetical protein
VTPLSCNGFVKLTQQIADRSRHKTGAGQSKISQCHEK